MFHPQLKQERHKFLSNPPLPEKPTFVPAKDKNGNFRNELKFIPGTNKPDHVVHFARETMSLRAQLNLGVKFSEVYLGQVENDPNVVGRNAVILEQQINQRIADIELSQQEFNVNKSIE